MKSKLKKSMNQSLHEHIKRLKAFPLSEIKKMPQYSDVEIDIDGKICTLAIWKNEKDDMVEVVLQVYYTGFAYRLIGAGIMVADGFVINSFGEHLPLPDEVRWEYC